MYVRSHESQHTAAFFPQPHVLALTQADGSRTRTDGPPARTISLKDLFDKLRAVHSRMERLSAVFRTTAPDFFAAYETARVIIYRPATQEGSKSPKTPQVTQLCLF
jgi:hypothetical protein